MRHPLANRQYAWVADRVASAKSADFFGTYMTLFYAPGVLRIGDDFLAIEPIPNWRWLRSRAIRVGRQDISAVQFRSGVLSTQVRFITRGGQEMEPHFRTRLGQGRIADALRERGWPITSESAT